MTKKYKRIDLLEEDKTEFRVETLEEMKDWLIELWEDSPNQDMDEAYLKEMIQEIRDADLDVLELRMEGVGFTFEEYEEEAINSEHSTNE